VNGYIGSPDDLTPVDIGENARLDYGVRADADELVAVLRSQALAAVVAGGAFAADADAQMTILAEAGTWMLNAKESLLSLRATVGVSQFAVERSSAERVSERDVLEQARTRIMATDPLATASTYQTLQVQLESIYTVTSRLANLRFTNFLR
jgi:flagellar hook-associated protein 3 FlgL